MRRISTGIEQLTTTDDVAQAVVTYATVLARANTADTITIPIVMPDGTNEVARLLLGPASQLSIVPDGADEFDLAGAAEVVDDLSRRTARLEPPPLSAEEGGDASEASFPDFDDYR